MDYTDTLREIASHVQPYIGSGEVASYIPPLAKIDPRQFGMALYTLDEGLFVIGDAYKRFSIQSISKVFAFAMAFNLLGDDIWSRLDREPSGTPFNSLVQLEVEYGKPRNPFINAGALVVADILVSHFAQPSLAVLQYLRRLVADDSVDIDLELAKAEQHLAHRNIAMAHFMKSFGNLQNGVDEVVDAYCNQCAIALSCAEVVMAGAFLANSGTCPIRSTVVTSRRQTRRINALMATCGTYDAAGDVAYRVGLPAKSGVGGGILAVVPGKATACVWAPGLDESGNSLVGTMALERLTEITGWSIF
ncbi:glutaminase [Herbaspirillum sp. GCM10030257]|uniref:glutaminase n=1 Tax=Herbaspirillum sp. GCM10030257 TaxID=3273393 RepID=UPI003619A60C